MINKLYGNLILLFSIIMLPHDVMFCGSEQDNNTVNLRCDETNLSHAKVCLSRATVKPKYKKRQGRETEITNPENRKKRRTISVPTLTNKLKKLSINNASADKQTQQSSATNEYQKIHDMFDSIVIKRPVSTTPKYTYCFTNCDCTCPDCRHVAQFFNVQSEWSDTNWVRINEILKKETSPTIRNVIKRMAENNEMLSKTTPKSLNESMRPCQELFQELKSKQPDKNIEALISEPDNYYYSPFLPDILAS
jgi:hypothetical protein